MDSRGRAEYHKQRRAQRLDAGLCCLFTCEKTSAVARILQDGVVVEESRLAWCSDHRKHKNRINLESLTRKKRGICEFCNNEKAVVCKHCAHIEGQGLEGPCEDQN